MSATRPSPRHPRLRHLLVAASGAALPAALLFAACSAGPESVTAGRAPSAAPAAEAHAGHNGPATTGERQQAARVREATAAFRDLDAAKAAGYTAQYPAGCAQLPDGSAAQGFHYLNPALVDGKTELLRPELVMYEPQADGSLALVGVDYVIPFDQWKGAQPPVLLGRKFLRNEPLGVWALHIWTERENANGLFAAWNPAVSCRYAS